MKRQATSVRNTTITLKKVLCIVLCTAVLIILFPAGKTLAQQYNMSESNEYCGTSTSGPPATPKPSVTPEPSRPPRPPGPSGTPGPPEPPEPPGPGNPSVPITVNPVPAAPVQNAPGSLTPPGSVESPVLPQTPAGPFDPGEQPKTDDNTDIRPLFAGLAIGTLLLRYMVFGRRRG